MKIFFRSAWDYFGRYRKAQVSLRAAALSFDTLLGIVPIIGLVFWYLSRVGITEKWINLTRDFLLTQLNVKATGQFLNIFNKLTNTAQSHSWGWLGLVVLIYTVWNLISRFGDSVDFILQVRTEKDGDPVTMAKLVARRLFVMIGLPIALVFSVVMSNWIQRDSFFHRLFESKQVGPLFALPLAWLGTTVAIFFIYYWVPRRRVAMKAAFKVALFIAPTIEASKYFFGLYNRYAVTVHKVYGVLAVIPLFFLWVYLMWTMLLVGALFLKDVEREGRPLRARPR